MDTTISSVRTASDRDPDCQSLASCVSITVSCASYADVTVAAHHHDSTHDGSASEASYIQKLWPAPKKLCLLGNLTAENAPLCLKTLHLPFAENVLINGKLPADSSGVLIFVVDEDEFESPIVSYLGDVMTEQNSMLSSSLPCPVLESPGIVRLVSVKVLDDLSSRLPSPEEVIREVISFKRPVLSLALLKDRFVFTGFTSKDYVRYLTKLVHRMGGSVMQDTDSSTTHLIAKKACGPKYHYCKIFNVPVLKKEWVEDLWDAAKTSTPAPVEMDKYFCPLFFELRVGFVGFSKEKLSEIQACLEQNGGKMTRPDAERVDFIVVNEPAMQDTPLPALNPKAALVTEAWFWESVVKGRVLMDEFRYKLRPDMSCKSPSVESSRSSDTVVPGPAFAGSGKARRRSFLNLKSEKRKKEELGRSPAKTDTSVDTDSTLKVEETNDTESVDALNSQRSMGKLTSKRSLLNGADQSVGSVGDINLTSESVGSMDHSSSSLLSPTPIDSTPKVPTARRQVFWELLQTEKNYVQVLDLIMRAGTDWRQQEAEMVAKKRHSHAQKENVVEGGFKVPGNVSLHVSSSREKDFVSGHGSLHTSLLDTSHSDPDIFDARILDMLLATITPLQKVHTRLLATLQTLEASWDENSRVGLAIASELGREDFINAYKNYVKDVDQVKAELKKLSSTYPRFHAYLRAVQLKPEYRRQGLDELLIRPIQRLPSMILLLKDLWKRTAAHLYDYLELVRALELAEMITSRTNDERRMYEKQRGIMRLIYEIEDCPPDILSWSTGRQLIANFDVVDLNNCTGKRGSPLVIFFLTDVLMICKKRSSKILGSSILRSSPSVNSLHSEAGVEGVINSGQKPYRFVCWLELRYVKVLLDLRYSGKDQDLSHLVQDGSFGLCIQRDGELDQTNYAFHVFRGGTVSDMCGGPPQSPSVTLERNTPPSVIAGGGVGNGMSGNGLAASGALGSTLSLSEIAVSKAEGPKQELLRLLTENVVRQTFQDPSCLVQSAEITQVNVDPHQYPRLVSGSNSSNPFHRMTRKMSFRTGGNSNSGPTTPLKRSYSTITPSSAGPHLGSQAPAMQSDVTSSLKKPTTASFTDGKDEREEFLAPLPPSNSFAKPSPFKKTTSSSSFKKQFSRLTQFAFSRTSSASNTSSSSMSPGAATNSPSSEKRKA